MTDELRISLRERAADSRGCYERALKKNRELRGRVEVSLRIAPTGAVCSGRAATTDFSDRDGLLCVEGHFVRDSYARPEGGCIDVLVPINFVPKPKPAPAGDSRTTARLSRCTPSE